MKQQDILTFLIPAIISFLVAALEHEKSFLVQQSASVVQSIAVYEGSLLLTVSNDIVQKDIQTGAIQRTFRSHKNAINDFVLTDDRRMITAGYDDMIVVWSLETGSVIKRVSLKTAGADIQSVFFEDNTVFVGGMDRMVRQVDINTGKILRTFGMSGTVSRVTAGADYLYVASHSSPYLSKLSIQTGNLQLYFNGHTDTVFSMYLHEEILFSGSADKLIFSWNVNNGELIRSYVGHANWVTSVAILDGDLYSGGDDGYILKWNIDDGQLLRTFDLDQRAFVSCLDLREHALYAGSFNAKVTKFDSTSGNILKSYEGKNSKLLSLALWKSLVISGGDDGEIKIWDSTLDTLGQFVLSAAHIFGVTCLSVQRNFLFSGSADGTVKQWELPTLNPVRNFEANSDENIYAIAVDVSFLYAAGSEALIYYWNISSGIQTGYFTGHTDFIGVLILNSGILYSGSRDETIRSWDARLFEERSVFNMLGGVSGIAIQEESIISCTTTGMELISIAGAQRIISLSETSFCNCIVLLNNRVYTGYTDSIIRVRDSFTLVVLEAFQGHSEYISELALDESNILYSSSLDGSVKKWNMASRKVAFSFENRDNSVTSLLCVGNQLFAGLKSGTINSYNMDNTMVSGNRSFHNKAVSSLAYFNGYILSSGLDGLFMKFPFGVEANHTVIYKSPSEQLKGISLNRLYFMAIEGDNQVLILSNSKFNLSERTFGFQTPLTCLTASDERIFVGTKSGAIFVWDFQKEQIVFQLKTHVSQVNDLLLTTDRLFSASDDKSIIEWSLVDFTKSLEYKRLSASTLGHLGPVNSLSYCSETLLSAGSDLTVRRWNTNTASHEDVYFGFTKSVTSVFCYNGSVFAGSEDFSVLMYRPNFPQNLVVTDKSPTTVTKKNTKQRRIVSFRNAGSSTGNVALVSVSASVVLAVIILVLCGYLILKKRLKKTVTQPQPTSTGLDTLNDKSILDLNTILNSVMGISKHASYFVEKSAVAQIKKIAAGGGGELFLAKIMDPLLRKKHGETVIQKVVFIKSKTNEEAFYQEVGIMIMLSTFPSFCQIIGFTENPSSMLLKYYYDGSLFDVIRKKTYRTRTKIKLLREISAALNVMHSHYLAHCDLKTQNVLVEITNGIPSCFLTDFGITQILSDKIIASRSFNVINLRGLSVIYAAPESFRHFREKNYAGTDFKKYDVYSFGCVAYEILTAQSPWS